MKDSRSHLRESTNLIVHHRVQRVVDNIVYLL